MRSRTFPLGRYRDLFLSTIEIINYPSLISRSTPKTMLGVSLSTPLNTSNRPLSSIKKFSTWPVLPTYGKNFITSERLCSRTTGHTSFTITRSVTFNQLPAQLNRGNSNVTNPDRKVSSRLKRELVDYWEGLKKSWLSNFLNKGLNEEFLKKLPITVLVILIGFVINNELQKRAVMLQRLSVVREFERNQDQKNWAILNKLEIMKPRIRLYMHASPKPELITDAEHVRNELSNLVAMTDKYIKELDNDIIIPICSRGFIRYFISFEAVMKLAKELKQILEDHRGELELAANINQAIYHQMKKNPEEGLEPIENAIRYLGKRYEEESTRAASNQFNNPRRKLFYGKLAWFRLMLINCYNLQGQLYLLCAGYDETKFNDKGPALRKSLESYRKGLDYNPNDASLKLAIGLLYSKAKGGLSNLRVDNDSVSTKLDKQIDENQTALKYFEEAQKEAPLNPHIWHAIAFSLYQIEYFKKQKHLPTDTAKLKQAERYFLASIYKLQPINPGDINLLIEFSLLLQLRGKYKEALHYMDLAFKADPAYPMIAWYREQLLKEQGDITNAIRVLKDGIKVGEVFSFKEEVKSKYQEELKNMQNIAIPTVVESNKKSLFFKKPRIWDREDRVVKTELNQEERELAERVVHSITKTEP